MKLTENLNPSKLEICDIYCLTSHVRRKTHVCSSGVDVSFFPPFVTHLRQTKQDDWKRW